MCKSRIILIHFSYKDVAKKLIRISNFIILKSRKSKRLKFNAFHYEDFYKYKLSLNLFICKLFICIIIIKLYYYICFYNLVNYV